MGWNMYLDHGIHVSQVTWARCVLDRCWMVLDSIRIYSFTMGLHLSHTDMSRVMNGW